LAKKVLIFDLDGTLIDSLKDIALSTNDVLTNLGFETYSIDEYKKFVGNGAKELVKNAMPRGMSEEEIQKALLMFKEIYGNKIHNNTKPFRGIYEMLDSLQKGGYVFGLLSNKPHKFTLQYMDKFFKDYNFEQISGQKDDIPRKPDPTSAKMMAKAFDVEANSIYYIGDTKTDMKTATGAGFIPIGVLWGYQDKNILVESGAKYIVSSPKELQELLLLA